MGLTLPQPLCPKGPCPPAAGTEVGEKQEKVQGLSPGLLNTECRRNKAPAFLPFMVWRRLLKGARESRAEGACTVEVPKVPLYHLPGIQWNSLVSYLFSPPIKMCMFLESKYHLNFLYVVFAQ